MLIWYFSNNLDIYEYVGKLPDHLFIVCWFSDPGDKILFVLKFNEARISESKGQTVSQLFETFGKCQVQSGILPPLPEPVPMVIKYPISVILAGNLKIIV